CALSNFGKFSFMKISCQGVVFIECQYWNNHLDIDVPGIYNAVILPASLDNGFVNTVIVWRCRRLHPHKSRTVFHNQDLPSGANVPALPESVLAGLLKIAIIFFPPSPLPEAQDIS